MSNTALVRCAVYSLLAAGAASAALVETVRDPGPVFRLPAGGRTFEASVYWLVATGCLIAAALLAYVSFLVPKGECEENRTDCE